VLFARYKAHDSKHVMRLNHAKLKTPLKLIFFEWKNRNKNHLERSRQLIFTFNLKEKPQQKKRMVCLFVAYLIRLVLLGSTYHKVISPTIITLSCAKCETR